MAFLRRRGTSLLILLAVLSLVVAGVYGQVSYRSDLAPDLSGAAPDLSGIKPYLLAVLPEAAEFELLYKGPDEGSYLYIGSDTDGGEAGYVTAAEAPGYGGPMVVTVGWSLSGAILALEVPEHYEDMPWFQPMYDKGFFSQYVGRQYSEPLELDNDIDAVTGSTVSSDAVAIGVQRGRGMVAKQLGDALYPVSRGTVSFGAPELLLLGGLGSVVALRMVPGLRRNFRRARYLTLVFGLAVLGIWLVVPLSLFHFTIWMVGFTPSWQSHLFLYILVFGVVALAVVFAKNFYCFWLCPFAAVQEGMHFIGGRRVMHPTSKWQRRLRKTRYVLLWLSLFMALLLRTPSVVNIEPWHTLFSLRGWMEQWLLVAVALTISLFVYDFWCHYLCPVGAVMDIILQIRRRLRTIWSQKVRSR